MCSLGDIRCIKRYRWDKPFIGKLHRQECSRFPCPKPTTSEFDAVVLKGGLRMTFAAPTAFDPAAFLASAGLGRRIVELKPKQAFFSQGDPPTRFSIYKKGVQRSPLYRRRARKPRSLCLYRTNLWERKRYLQCRDCVYPRPPLSPPARHSK